MSSFSARDFINRLNTHLAADLAARCVALSVTAPAITYLGIQSLRFVETYPALYIISPRARVKNHETMGNDLTAAQHRTQAEVAVGILAINADGEALQTDLYRYAEAVVASILAGRASAYEQWQLETDEDWEIDTETYRFREETRATQWLGEMGVAINAYREESVT